MMNQGGVKPYPHYKDSGVPWLGEVPGHWEVRRLRDSITACVNGIWGSEPDGANDIPCVRVADFDRTGLRVREHIPTVRAVTRNERKRRILRQGDLLLEKSGGGELQPVGVVIQYTGEAEAVCSNFVARMPVGLGYSSRFLTYLHSHLYAIRLNSRSIKQTTGIQNLDSTAYLGERVSFPPLEEQTHIARYLDHADRRIRRYIRAKQKLIRLLEEQEQAITQHAVTRGIDPTARLKPSGVNWLGDVPEHWEVVSLGRAVESIQTGPFGSQLHSEDYAVGGIPVINPSHMRDGRIQASAAVAVSEAMANSLSRHKLCASDVVVARRGELGRCAVVTEAEAGWLCGTGSLRIRPRPDAYLSTYLVQLLGSPGVRDTLRLSSIGATMDNLNEGLVSRLRLPCPSVDEQRRIVACIVDRMHETERAKDGAYRQIASLQEYRIRLIADVVTGKLDVREAAAALPEQLDEAEDLTLDDTLAGDDEAELAEDDVTDEEAVA